MVEERQVAEGLTPAEIEFVPPAVKRQLEAAEALVKSRQEEVVAPDVPAVEPVVETPAPAPPVERKQEDWKHKYQVLKGKYDTEMSELTGRLQLVSGTIESQTGLIEELHERATRAEQAAAATPAPAAAPKASVLDEKEFEGYGDQIVNMVRKVNALAQIAEEKQTVAPQTSPGFEQRLARIEQRSTANAEMDYFRALDNGVPDWKTLNKDPKFLVWLNLQDPITEIVRMQAIKRGSDTFNARQVINIFKAYKQEAGIVDKPVPVKKSIDEHVQVVPTAAGADATADADARNSGKYASRDEFLKAKDLYIKGRMLEADFNKVANRFQNAIRDKKVS